MKHVDMWHDARMTSVKTQIVFPAEVLQELDSFVGERKRSEFVLEAVQEKLQRLEASLARVAGIWKDRPDQSRAGPNGCILSSCVT